MKKISARRGEEMTRRFQQFFAAMLLVTGMLCPGVLSAAAPDPTQQLKPFIDKITSILASSSFENESRRDICQRVIDVAPEGFDFREMSKRVLGKQWRDLDAKQQEDFVALFMRLLQWAYIGKIEEYAGQSVEFVDQRVRGNRAEVKTLLVDAQRTVPVSYIMLLKKEQWKVYDVVVEGVSLIRNYMEQFRDILRTEGFPVLVEKIKKKINELEAQDRAAPKA